MITAANTRHVAALLCASFAASAAHAELKPGEERHPNVIFILADDQGWGDAGYAGHPYARTPNLDRLAADGTFIKNFYVNGTVCSPSRAALLTGMYPARLGFHHITSKPEVNKQRQIPDWLDPEVTTIADMFKKAGYATAQFGKWHLGKYAGSPPPTAYGFDVSAVLSGSGDQLRKEGQKEDPFLLTATTFDRAIEFIGDHKDKPFYINVWSPLPHAPLRPMPEQIQAFRDLKPDPASFGKWMGDYFKAARAPAGQLRTYLAAIAEVDLQIGRLREAVAQLGLANDTIIVFSSDNGPEDYAIGNSANAGMGSAGPLRGRKRSLYEGGTRVPFVAVWPGQIPAGRVDDQTVVSGVDLMPTLASLAGIPCDVPGIDGENLSAALRGGSAPRQRPVHWEWFFEVVGNPAFFSPPLAVRDGPWKFYCDYAGANTQLYDITKDPEEMHDVSAQHQDVVDRLRDSALAWVKTLPPAPLRDAVAKGADRMTLLDIREARPKPSGQKTQGHEE